MSGKRNRNEDQAGRNSTRPPKKAHLDHDSYTVAWICALPLEMAAACAMLDDVHEALPQDVNDSNCYALGIIGQHNVAIACLPNGEYGTNNAAIVFTNMKRTFKNIHLGLMVGIGGGAPSKADLRLGDIVVGSKVVHHDMGKAIGGGLFSRTSIPRAVPTSISTVVSSLRSKHYSSPSRVPAILRERAEALRGFERPLSADRLFSATYQHEVSTPDCVSCDQSELVQRPPRDSNDPFIHYGAIASGNKVIKDSIYRDQLAEDMEVICFEMEAAGLMDICRCLPVRGICDYSDSHKAKEWQKYAAATAAAYAREFLEELPVSERQQHGARPRQLQLDEKDNECLRDLRITNPQDDKETIVNEKGGLLIESYSWVMENESYQQWFMGNESRLLWIKGDPGKGKTMLLCGIIDQLEISSTPDSVFYFFCQASEPRLRSASAVLRGLIWFLVRRRPSLISHIRAEYDQGGKNVFNDHNALQALSSIMSSMLDDETTHDCIFVIDALDECLDDRERLIELFTRFSSSSESRWIVSSRNWPEIEAQLDGVATNQLHLELNHASIADAVQSFIARRVEDLAQKKRYTESTRDAVLEHLLSNANDTFLWVSLVCQELGKYNVLPHHTSNVLQSFPAGLDKLYKRMMNQLLYSRDEDICKAILAVVTTAFEPLSLAELATSDERLVCFHSDLQKLSTIVTCCGSFLAIRNNIVYTVHQSVKDYLITSSDIFPSSIAGQHYAIFQNTMDRIQATLHRNIYNADRNTLYIHEIPKPPSTVLDFLKYGCIYWVDHLLQSASHAIETPSTCLIIETFLKTKYLYWLEAMSLLGCVSTAIKGIRKLGSGLPGVVSLELNDLVEDALRFALTHRAICDTVPLQLYDSAMIFSPEGSQVRRNFINGMSANISPFTSSFQQWNACLFSIPSIAEHGSSLIASPDGQRLALIQHRSIILVLDSFTGETVKRIRTSEIIESIVGFDAQGKYLITSRVYDENYYHVPWKRWKKGVVRVWNTYTGEFVQEFDGHANIVVLSQDKMFLALAEHSGEVHVCDPWDGSGKYTINLRRGEGSIEWIDFGLTKSGAPCLFTIITTNDKDPPEVVVQNPETGHVVARASLASRWHNFHAALNPDGKRLLIAQNKQLQLWNGEMLTNLRCVLGPTIFHTCYGVAWTPDGRSFAVATNDAVILYDPEKQTRIGRVSLSSSHATQLCCVSGTNIAFLNSTSIDRSNATSTLSVATFNYDHASTLIHHLNPGQNGQLELSNWLLDNEIIITADDVAPRRFHIPDSSRRSEGVFSPDHHYALVDNNGLISIWDTNSWLCLHKRRGHANDTESSNVVVEFDPLGQLVSANHEDGKIRIWNPTTGDCLRTIRSQHWSCRLKIAASADGRIAIVPQDEMALYTWDLGRVPEVKTERTLGINTLWWPPFLSFNSTGLLAVLWHPSGGESCVNILDVSLGTCLKTYSLSYHTPYARFRAGSNSQIDVGHGVLDLDLERLTEAEQGVAEGRFRVHSQNALSPVWNQQFLRFDPTRAGAWLMRGSKKILWVPQSAASSVRLIPNFETGSSMAAMVYNSHALISNFTQS